MTDTVKRCKSYSKGVNIGRIEAKAKAKAKVLGIAPKSSVLTAHLPTVVIELTVMRRRSSFRRRTKSTVDLIRLFRYFRTIWT